MATSTGTEIGSRIVSALERRWQEVMRRHPDVPPVVIVISSARGRYGHYSHARWVVGEEKLAEVMISAEGLMRPVNLVMEVLLHEAAHGIAHTRNVRDTSRGGRYHNKKFAALAEEVGLAVIQPEAGTGMGFETQPSQEVETYDTAELEEHLVAYREQEVEMPRPPDGDRWISARCGCYRLIRLSRSTLKGPPIQCMECEEYFG